MNDQKIENLLNLALDATESERERSMELDVGYDPVDRRWDLIVKYSGDIQSLEDENIRVVVLLNEYAIISVPQNMIDRIASSPFVEYIEKPKRLFLLSTRAGEHRVSIRFKAPSSTFLDRALSLQLLTQG